LFILVSGMYHNRCYNLGISERKCTEGPAFSGCRGAIQNGLLTAIVTDEEAAEIMEVLQQTQELSITVDLEEQTILCGNRTYKFSIDPVRRMRLLNGRDDIALTENYRDRISNLKASDQKARPWAIPKAKT
jgi:3-isopropylmalate/(R)-2-methylmalate dehydratase small subunit